MVSRAALLGQKDVRKYSWLNMLIFYFGDFLIYLLAQVNVPYRRHIFTARFFPSCSMQKSPLNLFIRGVWASGDVFFDGMELALG